MVGRKKKKKGEKVAPKKKTKKRHGMNAREVKGLSSTPGNFKYACLLGTGLMIPLVSGTGSGSLNQG